MSEQTHLWWHLIEHHGCSPQQTHGDPELMHAAAHAFGISDHDHPNDPHVYEGDK